MRLLADENLPMATALALRLLVTMSSRLPKPLLASLTWTSFTWPQ